jgi:Dna[CI] antecedent, DciA
MNNDFISLGDAIEREPSLSYLRDAIKDSDIIVKFYEIFNDLEKIVVPKKIKKSILYLEVENSVWRSELKFKEQIIIDKINMFIKEDRIKKIKFV